MSHNNPFIALYGVYLGNLDKQRINFPESIIIRGEEGDSLKAGKLMTHIAEYGLSACMEEHDGTIHECRGNCPIDHVHIGVRLELQAYDSDNFEGPKIQVNQLELLLNNKTSLLERFKRIGVEANTKDLQLYTFKN